MGDKSGRGRGVKRLGVYLPQALHTWLKVQAALQQITMAALLERILGEYRAEVTRETEENPPSLGG